jgi:hypothetical protein
VKAIYQKYLGWYEIQLPPCRPMDCFVAEFIIGPAEGRTRWLLAMTTGR